MMGNAGAVDTESFRRAMAQLPTFVTVIATQTAQGPVGCTASAVLSLSLRPSSVLVSLDSGSRTLGHILAAGAFAVNGLAWEQRALCRRFAVGDPTRRFDGVDHRLRDGVPVLDDSVVSVVCLVEHTLPVHDHTLLVGRVVWASGHGGEALVLRAGAEHRC